MKKLIFFSGLIVIAVLVLNLSYAVSASFPKPDSVITAQLQTKISDDPVLSKLPVTVTTNASVVKIEGTVNTAQQVKQIILLAQSIAGVKSVDISALYFKSNQQLSADDLITSQVTGLLVREGILGPYASLLNKITVQTHVGVIYLSGTVGDNATVDKAVQFARTIPNVQDVQSSLTVTRE